MDVDFLQAAEAEFREAISYYNGESEGLGFEFAAEVRRATRRIVDFSEAWAPLSERTRRCRLKRFPYGLIYQIRPGPKILIVAVMHLRRDPTSWHRRVPPEAR